VTSGFLGAGVAPRCVKKPGLTGHRGDASLLERPIDDAPHDIVKAPVESRRHSVGRFRADRRRFLETGRRSPELLKLNGTPEAGSGRPES
jgi:hypothetical protein